MGTDRIKVHLTDRPKGEVVVSRQTEARPPSNRLQIKSMGTGGAEVVRDYPRGSNQIRSKSSRPYVPT